MDENLVEDMTRRARTVAESIRRPGGKDSKAGKMLYEMATGLTLAQARIRELETALATKEAHPDDLAVDRFAAAMKEKLAKKRAQGRRGWDDKSECSNAFLVKLLCEHVAKGDPVDVGNFAMMIHQRGERICT